MSRTLLFATAILLDCHGRRRADPDRSGCRRAHPQALRSLRPGRQQPGPNGELAPRLQNLGSHTFPVSTKNAEAQAFMNQGLNLAYAFNHAEARRAFREAARLDPDAGDGLLGPGAGARARTSTR